MQRLHAALVFMFSFQSSRASKCVFVSLKKCPGDDFIPLISVSLCRGRQDFHLEKFPGGRYDIETSSVINI